MSAKPMGKPTDGIISRTINRKISSRITLALLKLAGDVSPNKVTVATATIGVLSPLLYLLDMPVLAGILVQLSSILDGVDGEIARMLGRQSKFGAFLDSVLDRIVDITTIAALSLYTAMRGIAPQGAVLVLALLAISGGLMVSYVNGKSTELLGTHPSTFGVPPIATRDMRLFIVFLGSVIGGLLFEEAFVATLAILALLSYIYVFATLVKASSLRTQA